MLFYYHVYSASKDPLSNLHVSGVSSTESNAGVLLCVLFSGPKADPDSPDVISILQIPARSVKDARVHGFEPTRSSAFRLTPNKLGDLDAWSRTCCERATHHKASNKTLMQNPDSAKAYPSLAVRALWRLRKYITCGEILTCGSVGRHG